ncbi:MAG: C40 family peptidase [Lachnospiraceae bacterium]|nr:C40 family peptidase [Lachnospiraceae bacterium]
MKRFICSALIFILTASMTVSAYAAKSKTEINREKAKSEEALKEAQSEVNAAEEDVETAQAEMAQTEEQLTSIISAIQIIEGEMDAKAVEIEQAKKDYEAAKEKEDGLYDDMCQRIRYIYENGDSSQTYLKIFLESKDMAEFLNKQKYTSQLYEFDKKLLEEYREAKDEVYERELALQTDLDELDEERDTYEEQQKELEKIIDEQRGKIENFEGILSSARNKASEYKKKINEQNAEIRKIEQEEAAKKKAEEEARKKAEEEAAKKKAEEEKKKQEQQSQEQQSEEAEQEAGESEGEEESSGSSGGGGTGSEVASYAQQFIGNPYVSGGTSLTDGCDCSGFTFSVYKHFGYSIPRTSWEQQSCGRGVSYSEAQPGDIMCYAGHVGIYIGNGMIVHASTPATGIKVTPATYREILAVRRVV